MENCRHVTQLLRHNRECLGAFVLVLGLFRHAERVQTCLTCHHVACGRYNEGHALDHFRSSKHPLAMEVNEGVSFCYSCDDYIFNDNLAGDIRLLRESLLVVARQPVSLALVDDCAAPPVAARRRSLRSSVGGGGASARYDVFVCLARARRINRLDAAFTAWRNLTANANHRTDAKVPVGDATKASTSSTQSHPFEETIRPGVTGLRNLGNTCYMNSVLQVLSNLDEFRAYFLDYCPLTPMLELKATELSVTPEPRVLRKRRRVDECDDEATSSDAPAAVDSTLSDEVGALLRVMWSGRMSLVVPKGFLQAVWNRVPAFKGYRQQDAQEFLCEMLNKLSDDLRESDGDGGLARAAVESPRRQSSAVRHVIDSLFNGQLQSVVRCLGCDQRSARVELFSDLSLEFPARLQQRRSASAAADDDCHVTDMLESFTRVEPLGAVYRCDRCAADRSFASSEPEDHVETPSAAGQSDSTRSARQRRASLRSADGRHSSPRSAAEKQMLVSQLPQILRLHLKRFRWSGRNRREKLGFHVRFDEALHMAPYCVDAAAASERAAYRLCGVVMHHGRTFHSGHYTSYCWNSRGSFWVHCNDARLELASLDQVLASQAYILFYSRVRTSPLVSPATSSIG